MHIQYHIAHAYNILLDSRMTVNIVAGHELALTCDQKNYSILYVPVELPYLEQVGIPVTSNCY